MIHAMNARKPTPRSPGGRFQAELGEPTRPPPARARSYWDEEARRILRSEMERRGIGYKELVSLLAAQPAPALDFKLTERNLISRVTRGSFSFSFALVLLRAMDVAELDIRSIQSTRRP